MIRINLIGGTIEETPRIWYEFWGGVAILIVFAVVLIAVGVHTKNNTLKLKTEKRGKAAEVKRLEKIIERSKKLKKNKEALQKRLKVIKNQRIQSKFYIVLMTEFTKLFPKEIWIRNWDATSWDRQKITGNTLTMTALSDLIANAQRSEYFKRATLETSSAVRFRSFDIYKFELTLGIEKRKIHKYVARLLGYKLDYGEKKAKKKGRRKGR